MLVQRDLISGRVAFKTPASFETMMEEPPRKSTRCQQTARVSAQPLLTPGLVDAVGHYGGNAADTEHHW